MVFLVSPNLLRWRARTLLYFVAVAGLCAMAADAIGQGPTNKPSAAPTAKEIGEQVRQALESGAVRGKQVVVGQSAAGPAAATAAPALPKTRSKVLRRKAAAVAKHQEAVEETIASTRDNSRAQWDYTSSHGPQTWASLKPEFGTCATGQRQSPINIDASATLRGPAEAIGFDYSNSGGTVINNGHTIAIDMHGDNGVRVRGARYQLLQVHFHHPSEERIDNRGFAMVAHLVHKDALGRLAVVAVLLEPGEANAAVHTFWTHMPLGPGDRVALPAGAVDLSQLLPKDQRYYQFMGSLTTPPCTEDVLWMVLKQPVTLSDAQMRLFAQQFPNNARPVQAINGRVIRDAQ